jgi:hypothetical protein
LLVLKLRFVLSPSTIPIGDFLFDSIFPKFTC